MTLHDKTALVTGAGAGIGRAIAQRLAADGARLIVADLDIAGANETVEMLTAQGHRALAVEVDVADEAQVQRMVDTSLAHFRSIDILVNNAAISTTLVNKPFENLSVAEWQRVMDVNTLGVFLCCRAVAATMRAQGSGKIVNMTSGIAFKGSPGLLHYVASKGALISMTRALSRELGPAGINVNAVAPGFTLSDNALLNADAQSVFAGAAVAARDIKRDAFPADIVGAVAFLSGPDSALVAGQILSVDGGIVYH